MDDTRFELMSCALLDKEPGVNLAELYGARFDAQYGIDCFGDTADGLQVISCKCYAALKRGDLAQWATDFLDHWDSVWKDCRVTRFILATAAATNSTERMAEIEVERKRFHAIGVEYEVWSPRQLQEKLRDQRGVVQQFLGGWWVSVLCGEPPAEVTRADAMIRGLLEDRVETLGHALGVGAEGLVDLAAAQNQQGRSREAGRILATVRTSAGWPSLSAQLRARTLRLQAAIALASENDLEGARRLGQEADGICAPADARLAAQIALREAGPLEALKILGRPTSEGARTLDAALRIMAGDLPGARATLQSLAETPERWRLQAHLELEAGDRTAAAAAAELAVKLAPDSLTAQRTRAVVRYSQALSPLARPELYTTPQPVAAALLREDDAAREELRQALLVFDDLIERASEGGPNMDRLWRLACLCILPDRREDASGAAAEILASSPTDPLAIGWAAARALDADLEVSRRALEEGLSSGVLDVNGPRTIEWLTPVEDREALLDRAQGALVQGAWSPDVADEIKGLVQRLRARAPSSEGDPQVALRPEWDVASVTDTFARLCVEDPTSPMLLGAAEVLARENAWSALTGHAQKIAAFGTAEAVRVAVYAALNGGDPLEALSLLEAHLSLFPGRRLPADLRRVKAEALSRQGEAAEAVSTASALSGETRSSDDFAVEANLRFRAGDLGGAVQTIRSLMRTARPSPEQALAWIPPIASEDLELARELWRLVADASPGHDDLAVAALSLAFQLGLENERPELFAVLNRLAREGRGGVQTMDITGALDLIRETRERIANISEMIGRSEIPIHLAIAATRANLADILWLDKAREDGHRPIHLRNGARPAEPVDGPLADRVLLDITALLVGDQLSLIDLLRRSGRELWVAPSTAAALLSIEEGLKHPQPRRGEVARLILAELGDRLQIVAPAECARVALETGPNGFDLAQVIAALESAGLIGAFEVAEARRVLNVTTVDAPAELARGCPIVFESQTLESLTDAGLLDASLGYFDAFIDAPALEMVRTEDAQAAVRTKLTTWVQHIRERLSADILSETVHVLPMMEPDATADWPSEPVARTLHEELSAGATFQGDLWVDDRMVSSYPAAGAARIVGVWDVLATLRSGRQISEDRYFEGLTRLRAAGALFLPVNAEEVSRALARARLVDGEIHETKALSALRRNVSLALLRQESLRQETNASSERPTELTFLMTLRRVAESSVINCWAGDASVEVAEAHSRWIWTSLRGELALKPTDAIPGRRPEIYVALNFAGLIAGLHRIGAGGGQTAWDRRASFLGWVADEAIGSRLAEEPELSRMFGDLTRGLLRLDLADVDGLDDDVRAHLRTHTRLVVAQLPAELQDIVFQDEGFFRDLGFDRDLALTLGDKRFSADAFWKAALEARKTGTAHVEALEDGGTLTLQRRDDGSLQLSGALEGGFGDPAVALLVDDPVAARSAARDYLRAIDIPESDADAQLDVLMGVADPHLRMRRAQHLREQSVPTFLATLRDQVADRAPVTLGYLRPPPFRLWLDFLRWPASSFDAASAQSACATELGAEVAAQRFAGLPIALDPVLGAALRNAPSPLTLLGLIHRLQFRRLTSTNEDLAFGASEVIDACLAHGEMFVTLLEFGALGFSTQPGWPQLPAAQKHAVVWTYAEQTTSTLLALNVDAHVIADFLRSSRPPLNSARMLKLERGYDDDPLHAMCVSHAAILLAGLEFALGSAADDLNLEGDVGDRLVQVVASRLENGRLVPRPLRTTHFATTALPTWMSRPSPDLVVAGGGMAEYLLTGAVETLERDPADPGSWRFLRSFGPPQLEPALRTRLSRVVDAVELAQVADRSDAPLAAIRDVGEVVSRLCDVSAPDRLLNQLFMLSGRWLESPPSPDQGQARSNLLEAAASLSKSFEPTGAQRLSQFLNALVARWPDVAAPTARVLARMVETTPVAESGPFQEAWLAARAI